MMLDADVVVVSPSSIYRVLHDAGLMLRHNCKPSLKGKGFQQPLKPHEHWHVDVSYINIAGTFFCLCSLLDGCSRFIVYWEIRQSMTETDIETIIQRARARARERYPDARPRVISDNGPQFIAKDFKEFIRLCGMTHVKTSPYYPQSNGKIERWHRSLKTERIRPGVLLSLEDAQGLVENYVRHYNEVRLHSALGYLTPADKLVGQD
jgi:putative transposase